MWQEVDTAIVSTEEDTAILSEYADPAYEYQTKTSKYWTLLKEDITAEAPIKLVGENAVITAVSYTHLDVYKRQALLFRDA